MICVVLQSSSLACFFLQPVEDIDIGSRQTLAELASSIMFLVAGSTWFENHQFVNVFHELSLICGVLHL